jgi:hypothetical protein
MPLAALNVGATYDTGFGKVSGRAQRATGPEISSLTSYGFIELVLTFRKAHGPSKKHGAAVVQPLRPLCGCSDLRIRGSGKLAGESPDTPEVITQKMRIAFSILSMSNELHRI